MGLMSILQSEVEVSLGKQTFYSGLQIHLVHQNSILPIFHGLLQLFTASEIQLLMILTYLHTSPTDSAFVVDCQGYFIGPSRNFLYPLGHGSHDHYQNMIGVLNYFSPQLFFLSVHVLRSCCFRWLCTTVQTAFLEMAFGTWFCFHQLSHIQVLYLQDTCAQFSSTLSCLPLPNH